jgi:hypothetical protein
MTGRPVLDIPIFHKIYDLYKLLHSYNPRIPKAERYTLWQKCENTALVLLETLIASNRLINPSSQEFEEWLASA